MIIVNANADVINLSILNFSLLFISAIKTVFDAAKDSYLKVSSEEDNIPHFTSQNNFVKAFSSAQMIGAISSGLMLYFFPIWVSLFLDFLSFIATAILGVTLSKDYQLSSNKGKFEFFYYLISSTTALDIFVLRSICFWVGVGICNFYNTYILMGKFGLPTSVNAVLLFIQGAGGAFGGDLSKYLKQSGNSEERISFIGHTILAIGIAGFIFSPNYYVAFIAIFVSSLGVGGNMSSSQALRAKVVSSNFFAEFVIFEMIVGRVTGGAVGAIAKVWGTVGSRPIIFMLSSAGIILVTGFLHLKIRGRNSTATIVLDGKLS